MVPACAADDLGDYWKPDPLLVPPPPIAGTNFYQRYQVPLARGKVRHVGEPVAVVVAESRYLARGKSLLRTAGRYIGGLMPSFSA